MATPSSHSPQDTVPLMQDDERQEYGTIVAEQASPRPTRRRSCCSVTCCCVVFFVVVLATPPLFILLVLYEVAIVLPGCPLNSPLCWPWKSTAPLRQHPDLSESTYHVGFHLTAGYGTAAIHYSNGTNVVVGRVDGDQAYKDFFTEISYEDSRHPSPPYYSFDNASSDAARQWKRHYRKEAGRPATEGVAALTRVLDHLIGPANETLGKQQPLRYATIAVPALPAIYTEDLVDATQDLGLSLIQGRAFSVYDEDYIPLFDIKSALVGMNFSYRLPGLSYTLIISYTDDLFTMHAADNGYGGYMWRTPVGTARADLGRKHLDAFSTLDEYWFAIQRAIHDVLAHDYLNHRHLEPIILHGERADDPVLRAILEHELNDFWQKDEDHVPLHSIDPVYAGAIGAAKLGLQCLRKEDDSYGQCFPDLRPKPARTKGW